MELKTEYLDITSETVESGIFPLPIDVFPNRMGINLCSVKGMEVVHQEDGQLVSIRVDFTPARQ